MKAAPQVSLFVEKTCAAQIVQAHTLDDQVGPKDTHRRDTDTSLCGSVCSPEAGEDNGASAAHCTKEGLFPQVSLPFHQLVIPWYILRSALFEGAGQSKSTGTVMVSSLLMGLIDGSASQEMALFCGGSGWNLRHTQDCKEDTVSFRCHRVIICRSSDGIDEEWKLADEAKLPPSP